LMCGLGAIDGSVNSVAKCPAQVMPRWLAHHVVYFFDNQNFDDAKKWGLEFYAELKRLNGAVPFSVMHDWQATTVAQLSFELADKKKLDKAPHLAKQALHLRAMAGDVAGIDEWRTTLKPAFEAVYLTCYADAADAYINADADADAYADDAYAYANDAYAYPDASANASANASAKANIDAGAGVDDWKKIKQAYVKRLADGMVECMKHVPTPDLP